MDAPSAVSTIYDPDADPAPWFIINDDSTPPPPAAARRRVRDLVVPAGAVQPVPAPAAPPVMPPPVPLPGTGPGGVLPGGSGFEVPPPRGPVSAVELSGTGSFLLRANDARDMEILLQLLDVLRRNSEVALPELRVVPLKFADSSYLAGTLNSVFARVQVGAGGNFVPPASRSVTAGSALTAAVGGPSAIQTVYCVAIPRLNALMIIGPKGRFEDILKEVERFDRPNDSPIRPFSLKKASAQVVAQQIRLLYSQRFPQEGPPNQQFRISYDLSSNTVLVQAAPADMKDIADLIETLDSALPKSVNDVRVFKLRNALADELASVLIQTLTANVVNPVGPATQPWYIQSVTGVGALGGITALAGGQQGGQGAAGGLGGGGAGGGLGGGGLGGGGAGGGLGGGGLGGGGLGGGGLGGTGTGAGLNAVIPTVGTSSGGGLTTKTNALRFYSTKDGQVTETAFLEDVHIVPNARTNSLLVTARPETMKLIEKLVETLDTVAAASAYINIFKLDKADATLTALLLQQLFTGQNRTGLTPGAAGGGLGGGGGAGGAAGGTLNAATGVRPLLTLTGTPSDGATLIDLRISVDDRTNSIIVAGALNDLETIRAIIARLEAADTQGRVQDVYKLRNAAAADVAAALQTFITNSLNVYSGAAVLSAYQQLQRNIVVVAEPVSNTILISATPQYFAEIRRLVERIDAQPPQVVIQVLIAEVQLTNTEEFGVEVGLQSPVLFGRSLTATGPGSPGFNFNSTAALPNATNFEQGTVGFQGLGNLGVGRTSTNGLGVGGLVLAAQSQSFNLLIRALKAQNRIDILSRPQIQVADNQTGFVQVGQLFPYLGNSTLTATGAVQQSIEQQQTGVVLRVVPRVNPDGKVLMRIEPSITSVAPNFVSLGNGITQPAFNTETVQTTVLASDGETIVLGGLISKQDNRVENGVPFFKDIPYVGALFRYRSHQVSRREVLIIMTPHIVRTEYDAARVLAEEARRIDWCLPDVAKIHGHGLEVIGPAMKGSNPVPVGGVPPGAIPPGMMPAGFGPGFVPAPTVPGPGGPEYFGLPPGTILPSGTVLPPLVAPVPPPGGFPPDGAVGAAKPAPVPVGVPTYTPGPGVVTPVAATVPQSPVQPLAPPFVMVQAGGVPPPAAPPQPATGVKPRGYVMTPLPERAEPAAPPAPAPKPTKPDNAKEGGLWGKDFFNRR